jgi:hypothetical protein
MSTSHYMSVVNSAHDFSQDTLYRQSLGQLHYLLNSAIKRRYLIECVRRVSGITFISCSEGQKMG